MRSRKELMNIAESMDTRGSYCSCYDFSLKYIRLLMQKEKGCEDFFEAVSKVRDNSDIYDNMVEFGKTGGKSAEILSGWCGQICDNEKLRDFEMEEIFYVMSLCSRLSKINKEQ